MLTRFASFAAAASLAVHQVTGHGYMVQPQAMFFSSSAFDVTSYVSTIDAYALYPDGTFNTDPADNVKSFEENFKNQTDYANIKELIEAKQVLISDLVTKDCGYTDPSQTSYGSLNSSVYWGAQGFTDSHEGPCEVWCDDNMAMQDMNCAADYPGNGSPSEVPIDKTKCTDAKRLTFYWIAMHGSTWQVYINCVNINGATSASTTSGADSTTPPAVDGSSSTTTTTSSSSSATTGPTSTTATPTTTMATPTTTSASASASTTDDEYASASSEASTAAEATDSASTEASASSTTEEYSASSAASTTTSASQDTTTTVESTTDSASEETTTESTTASASDEATSEASDSTAEEPTATTATPAATTATPTTTTSSSSTSCNRRMRK